MKRLIIIFIIVLIFTLGVMGLAWAKCRCTCQDDPRSSSIVADQSECNSFCDNIGYGPGTCKEISEAGKDELDNPLGASTIQEVVGQVIKAFLGIIGTISLVMFIYGGLLMLTSAGAAEKIKKGQQTLVWASLGILVVFASYAILKFVFSAFGL